jgi:hypothetical protein
MKRRVSVLTMGIMLIMALSPFVVSAAESYPIFGPQTNLEDKYLYFGNSEYPRSGRNGLDLYVDSTSISFQSVKAVLYVDHELIQDRNIQGFHILGNDVVVDTVQAYYDSDPEVNTYREVYYLDINITEQYVGSKVSFQAVAIHEPYDGEQYVVAWSSTSPVYTFKPLPVIDRDAIDILRDILSKLEEMKNALSGKLDAVKNAVEKIYTVTPETQTKFDNALENLRNNLPTEQIKDDVNEIKNTMDNAILIINNTEQPLTFGEINWMGVVKTPAYDFTQVAYLVDMMRNLMRIFIWCEFFFFIIVLLRPTLTA